MLNKRARWVCSWYPVYMAVCFKDEYLARFLFISVNHMRQLFRDDFANKKTAFLSVTSVSMLAQVLEIKKNHLVYYAYKKPNDRKYITFDIRKRSGKFRRIQAPIEPVKLIQKKLNYLLSLVYNPLNCAHGFIQGRSVLSNARLHVRKTYILNIDLQDYFPSIHFGRIFGLLQSPPFGFPKEVSAYLSQLCTCSGILPQGAPTSPLLANMITYSLDKSLMSISHENNLYYSRYADDLTFSTFESSAGQSLSNSESELRKSIEAAIQISGFKLNPEKIRFSGRYDHKEVTGIIVNKKCNVRRRYYRQIRAMLHAWEKYGYKAAEDEFKTKYDKRNRWKNTVSGIRFHKVVKGKIDWLQMIRGRDEIYRRLHGNYLTLMSRDKKEIKDEDKTASLRIRARRGTSASDFFVNTVFIIENDKKQGTCFHLKDIGFITCAHVIGDIKTRLQYANPIIFKSTEVAERYLADVALIDYDHDIAILLAPTFDRMSYGSLRPRPLDMPIDDCKEVLICGYPGWGPGRRIRIEPCRIVSHRVRSGVELIEVNGGIYEGNSGGPVFDTTNNVVGVAVVGSSTIGAKFETDAHCFLPIYKVLEIAAGNKNT